MAVGDTCVGRRGLFLGVVNPRRGRTRVLNTDHSGGGGEGGGDTTHRATARDPASRTARVRRSARPTPTTSRTAHHSGAPPLPSTRKSTTIPSSTGQGRRCYAGRRVRPPGCPSVGATHAHSFLIVLIVHLQLRVRRVLLGGVPLVARERRLVLGVDGAVHPQHLQPHEGGGGERKRPDEPRREPLEHRLHRKIVQQLVTLGNLRGLGPEVTVVPPALFVVYLRRGKGKQTGCALGGWAATGWGLGGWGRFVEKRIEWSKAAS